MKWITWHKKPWYRSILKAQVLRYSIYATIIASACYAVWYYGLSERVVTTSTWVIDPRLHFSMREHLIKSYPELDSGSNPLSCIKEIVTLRKNRTHTAIKVYAYTPLAVINDTEVLTNQGLLVGAHFYRPDLVMKLPRVKAPSGVNPEESIELVTFISTLPEYITKYATIVWKNPTEIELLFNKYPKNPVIITTQTELATQKLTAMQELISREDITQVDARFQGILVGKKGVHHTVKNKRRGS